MNESIPLSGVLNGSPVLEGFQDCFSVVYAASLALKREAYQLRHQVYAQELAMESSHKHGMDIDAFDRYSQHILLKHRQSDRFVACIRLVIPEPGRNQNKLPIEQFGVTDEWLSSFKIEDLTRGAYGEISRLAIPTRIDRMIQDYLGSAQPKVDSARLFPQITIALYLSAIGLANLLLQEHVFCALPPMLYKKLRAHGVMFQQISHTVEMQGTKAVYHLDLTKSNILAKPLFSFYDQIRADLSSQLQLYPTVEEAEETVVAQQRA
ncbi:MAG: PEP-CTERM/exosortase system-associated acyltransferase [Pseudomonadales bacterium]|nr:PEP-CTERM/exosortase system-associated acyltransferase [Pseudomonadales bacterium]